MRATAQATSTFDGNRYQRLIVALLIFPNEPWKGWGMPTGHCMQPFCPHILWGVLNRTSMPPNGVAPSAAVFPPFSSQILWCVLNRTSMLMGLPPGRPSFSIFFPDTLGRLGPSRDPRAASLMPSSNILIF